MSTRPDKLKSKRPANTAFKQQRLKAWQPILTPKTVLPAFFAVGVVFMPLGVGLYYTSEKVNQLIFDYTGCPDGGSPAYPITKWSYDQTSRICSMDIDVSSDFNGPVFLYYRLTNFYQNHRRYVKSYDSKQLANNPATNVASCFQLNQAKPQASSYTWTTTVSDTAIIYPCGLIANSYFTDEISDLKSSTGEIIKFDESQIAWPADAEKFKTASFATDADINVKVYPPPQWVKGFPGADFSKGYTPANFPDISKLKRLQVWMRPAGLPNFRKIWGKYDNNIPKGTYSITIRNNFDVNSYGGTKSIVISTVSILGGKNPFLGVAYIVVGALCWVLGIVFLLRHMIKPRKPGDYTYLSWNQPQREAPAGGAAH
ncbi:hypothetical protein HDU97_005496 [Phlyctochytrium planicorne]|nr:hypothetical protein HDU97_005496 [Phlyctochytrium planicorne]